MKGGRGGAELWGGGRGGMAPRKPPSTISSRKWHPPEGETQACERPEGRGTHRTQGPAGPPAPSQAPGGKGIWRVGCEPRINVCPALPAAFHSH